MILETEIEQKLKDVFSVLTEVEGYKIVCSRQVGTVEEQTEDADITGVITIAAGIRQHDNFSLPMINVPVSIAIVTRTETEPTGTKHENAVEAILNMLSGWHRFPSMLNNIFDGLTYSAGEIRMTGGSGRSYSKDMTVWTDSITFNIRGTEKFGI